LARHNGSIWLWAVEPKAAGIKGMIPLHTTSKPKPFKIKADASHEFKRPRLANTCCAAWSRANAAQRSFTDVRISATVGRSCRRGQVSLAALMAMVVA
jgi:hypothetical protein